MQEDNILNSKKRWGKREGAGCPKGTTKPDSKKCIVLDYQKKKKR